jgi:hypothetical protein
LLASPRLDDWRVIGPALVGRMALLMRSVAVLQDGDREQDAQILTRSLFDYVTTFAWLAVDPPSRLLWWLKEDLRQREAMRETLERWGMHVDLDGFRDLYVRDGDNFGRFPTLEQRAKQADEHWTQQHPPILSAESSANLTTMYGVMFRGFSATAHASSRGIENMTLSGATDDHRLIVPSATLERRSPLAFTTATSLFLIAMALTSRIFGWPSYSQITDIIAEDT